MKREEWVDEITETIQELWAGEVPLRPAFWIYGFAVVLGFKWAMRAMAAYGYLNQPVYLAVGAMAIVYSVFAAVSVWRSAAKFEGNRALAYAARVGVIVWPTSIFWGP